MDLLKYEKNLRKQNYKYIGGCDEAGRGPLFGPVVAACVCLPEGYELEGLNDSKKLTEKRREKFYEILTEEVPYGIGIIDADKIDEINIYQASRQAMKIAIEEVRKKIPLDYIITDAMPIEFDIPVMSIVKGDAKSLTIAAASVIAKVTRDRMMYEIDKKYPKYGFKNHKGYPTKKHLENIEKYGLIQGYRKTYGPVKKYLENMLKK